MLPVLAGSEAAVHAQQAMVEDTWEVLAAADMAVVASAADTAAAEAVAIVDGRPSFHPAHGQP